MKSAKIKREKSYKIKSDGSMYVGLFEGRKNSGPLQAFISISDDKEPGLGEWMTIPEARKLVEALLKCIEKATK